MLAATRASICEDTLAAFLRARRERLGPNEVGLAGGRRRRTPGLRREEVAELAGIGASWYTALEQGRNVRPSDEVLRNVARALQLTDAETDHLFYLGGRPAPPRQSAATDTVSAAMRRLLVALDPNPAYIAGRRWDCLAWNRAANAIFSLDSAKPPYAHNLLWWFFTRQKSALDTEWESTARSMTARFRAESARFAGDRWFEDLLNDLLYTSDDFRRLWSKHEIQDTTEGAKSVYHPTLGVLEVDMVPLQIPSMPGTWLMVYLAAPGAVTTLSKQLSDLL